MPALDPSLPGFLSDEKKAFNFLLSRLGNVHCPVCGSKKYYMLGRKRLRCTNCKKDYNPLCDSKFSDFNQPYSKLLYLLKLFEVQMSARSASGRAKVSLKTVQRFFRVARRTLGDKTQSEDLTSRMGYQGSHAGRSGTWGQEPQLFFGIRHKKEAVCIDVLQDVTATRLFGSDPKMVRRGNMVYTDRWQGYDSVVFYGYRGLPQEYKKRIRRGLVYIDKSSRFWSVAEERLVRGRPRSSEDLLNHLREQEWRYNNRAKDIFEMMVYRLVAEHA